MTVRKEPFFILSSDLSKMHFEVAIRQGNEMAMIHNTCWRLKFKEMLHVNVLMSLNLLCRHFKNDKSLCEIHPQSDYDTIVIRNNNDVSYRKRTAQTRLILLFIASSKQFLNIILPVDDDVGKFLMITYSSASNTVDVINTFLR